MRRTRLGWRFLRGTVWRPAEAGWHGAAGSTAPRASAPQEDVRNRVVLHGTAEESGEGVPAGPEVQGSGARPGRADSASGAAKPVRRPLSARPAMVLEGRFRTHAS